MSYNASYFVDTLPEDFNSWNFSQRWQYYNDKLDGFSQIANTTQEWVAENLDKEGIEWLWASVQDPAFVKDLMDLGYNTTWIFFDYLSNPEKVIDLNGYFTTPTTTAYPPSVCDYVNALSNLIVIYMAIPAVAVILFLSFLKRRKSLCKDCCCSRPHLLYPINFVDEHDQRWAYAAVFAILTYKVVSLFDQDLFWKPEEFSDPEWTKTYGFTKVFVVMLNVAMLCVVYYPFLACLVLRRMIIANVVALLYVVPWVWYFVEIWLVCPFWDSSHSDVDRNQAIMNFVLDLPIVLAFLCLIGTYIYNLVMSIKKQYRKKREVDYAVNGMLIKLMETDPLAVQYVRDLMKRQPKQAPKSIVDKVKHKVTYKRVIGFKYSPRVVCTMVVAGLGIYKFSVLFTGWTETFYQWGLEIYESLGEAIPEEEYNFYKENIYVIRWSVLASVWVSFLLHAVFMVHMVIMYRRHLRKYFQGDRSWHFESTSSPVDVMIASLRYSGYQMAYVLYGYIILLLLLTAVMAAFGIFIVLPLKYKFRGPAIQAFIDYWPVLLVSIMLLLLQKLLAKMCLLQGRGKYMALNNRRFYHVVSFFFFFYNFIVGLFSCLKRILFSVAFGTLLVSRLDHCLLMRGFERFDPGFRAYIGMLTIDVYHNHPVVKSFIYILQQLQEDKCHAGAVKYTQENGKNEAAVHIAENGSVEKNETPKRSKKYKNKWFKAVTLMRNPTLRLDLMKDEIKQNNSSKHAVRDAIISRTADIASGAVALGVLGAAT